MQGRKVQLTTPPISEQQSAQYIQKMGVKSMSLQKTVCLRKEYEWLMCYPAPRELYRATELQYCTRTLMKQ